MTGREEMRSSETILPADFFDSLFDENADDEPIAALLEAAEQARKMGLLPPELLEQFEANRQNPERLVLRSRGSFAKYARDPIEDLPQDIHTPNTHNNQRTNEQ